MTQIIPQKKAVLKALSTPIWCTVQLFLKKSFHKEQSPWSKKNKVWKSGYSIWKLVSNYAHLYMSDLYAR